MDLLAADAPAGGGFGEHTDVYLYGEQSEDHYFGLNLMTKLMLGLRLKGFGVESIPK